MEDKNLQPTEALKDIRQIMERSSRFISLSGLSGVAAGVCALGGAWIANGIIEKEGHAGYFIDSLRTGVYDSFTLKLFAVAAVTFTAAFISAFYLTWRKAKKSSLPVWDHTSKRLFWNMIIPMTAGGLFILGMLYYGEWRFVGPACLIFYGMALVNASKYTLSDIRYLGYCEIMLGLISIYFIGYGLYFWAAGFGALHIVYGTVMWFKYERK
ncbi:MAG: hypothetical protein HZB42_08925 [Sphingobacteriales bacterium]|nr:hypothetical protein [Sphingobacteriales bacterium]